MEEKVQNTTSSPEMAPNVEATIAYLIPVITGVALYLSRQDNKFVRFHAVQSVLFWVAVFAANMLSGALIPFIIGLLLQPIVLFASVGLWVFLMWKAYNNEEYMLPYLGKIAKDQVDGKFNTK